MENDHIRPVIYIISDSIGETAEFVVRAAASQFDSGCADIRRTSFVNNEAQLIPVIEEASEHPNSLIVYTMVSPELCFTLEKEAKKRSISTIDVMGPLIKKLSTLMDTTPRLEPGLIRELNEDYFRKIEAVEFAVKYDDGKDPRGLEKADIVLIGISRTSKTPLSMYLANKRLKVANVPIVPEVEPPEDLFQLPPGKIIGLTTSPQMLNQVREERLKTMGLPLKADYASFERILEELEYSERIMKRLRCPIINVTNKAVEETANKILQIIKKEEMRSE